ncbi:Transcription initiation factor TFIID subunit 14 [Cyberlindnera fabianii]|uniref:Transcription initiation factor TFIID subunit 14 n=1 Tax=Cyberlindnera fabianii TaxID=36022 RepID=A0A1V2LCA1_CYBFA|nr:Transcription initiation factor TFIID subunit 14 [Cyberlindnera fabianii]
MELGLTVAKQPKTVIRKVRMVTTQKIKPDVPSPAEGFPIREWSIELQLLDENGTPVPATIFDKVTFHLHPTFENPTRVLKKQPFRLQEEGWGGFEIPITITLIDKAGERKIVHDLNFLEDTYSVDHDISCPLNKSEKLRKLLAESGPVPSTPAGESIGDKRKAQSSSGVEKKRAKTSMGSTVKGSVDLEKLAEGLTKLNEDDLLYVVQMVTDNSTPDMNIKNDVEQGEFTMDLYTLPDKLLKSLADYVKKKTT